MREKIIPRVKNEDRHIPFEGNSEYKNQFPHKSAILEKTKNKDRMYTPCRQPFEGSTTYGSNFLKKRPNSHVKRINPDYKFPDGYGFNGSTTYGNSFQEKPLIKCPSYKPE